MMDRLDANRLNELTEYFVLEYLRKQKITPDSVVCIDIDGLVAEHFGYRIRYEHIAEDDKSITAFSPNGIDPLKVSRNGKVMSIVFPATDIILDSFYLRTENSTSRRFSIGHELGHKILAKVAPEHHQGKYQTIFDKERTYDIAELKDMLNYSELQANQFSAAVQLPMFLLQTTLKRVVGSDKFPVYGDFQMLPADSLRLKSMADDLGVATKTLLIRLRDCKLIEHRSMGDYVRRLRLGGVF